MLNIPANIVGEIASTTQATIAPLWDLAVIFISIPLAFYVIKRVMHLFPKGR